MRAMQIVSHLVVPVLSLALAGSVVPAARAQEQVTPMTMGTVEHQLDGGAEQQHLADASEPRDLSSSWVADLVVKIHSVLGLPLVFNVYSSDPNVRMEDLLEQAVDLRKLDKLRHWLGSTDQPSHMTYEHIHGGIGP